MRDPYYSGFRDSFAYLMLVVAGCLIAFLAALMTGIRYAQHYYDHKNCTAFSVNTGRETKFVDYTWWSWDCLTPTKDGKYIPIDQLRDLT